MTDPNTYCCKTYHTMGLHKDCVSPGLGEHCSGQLQKIVTQDSEIRRLLDRDAERQRIIDAALGSHINSLTALLRRVVGEVLATKGHQDCDCLGCEINKAVGSVS